MTAQSGPSFRPLHFVVEHHGKARNWLLFLVALLWALCGLCAWVQVSGFWVNTKDGPHNSTLAWLLAVVTGLPAFGISLYELWGWEKRQVVERADLQTRINRLEREAGINV